MPRPSARALLGPEGPLSQALDRYEARDGQLDMADAVERALDEGRVLLCEAGTGTGKTLAYLVPALLSGRRVVISTASRAWQEQIFDKDLPLARTVTGSATPAQLVKGLGNYLCRRRFSEFVMAPAGAKPEERRALTVLEPWAERSERGDIAEVEALSEDHPVSPQVVSSPQTRIGARCKHFEACFVTRMKRAAQEAQLLVVNHHMLMADLALRAARDFRAAASVLCCRHTTPSSWTRRTASRKSPRCSSARACRAPASNSCCSTRGARRWISSTTSRR